MVSPSGHRVGFWKQRAKLVVTLSGLVLMVLPPLGFLLLIIALAVPSRGKVLRADLAWRLDALKDLEGSEPLTLETIDRLLKKKAELQILDSEIPDWIENVLGSREALQFAEMVKARGGEFPNLPEHSGDILPDRQCFYAAKAVLDKRGPNDQAGWLFLTEKRAFFKSAEGATAIPWSKTILVARDSRRILIQREDRKTPTVFEIEALGTARIVEWIASNLRHNTLTIGTGEISDR